MGSVRARLLALLLPALLLITLAVALSGYGAASRRIDAFLDAGLADSARVLLLWTLAEPRRGDEVNAENVRRELDELFRGSPGEEGQAGGDPAPGRGRPAARPGPLPLQYVLTRPGIIDRVVSSETFGALADCAEPGYSRVRVAGGESWRLYTAVGGSPPARVCVGQRGRDRRAVVIGMLVPAMRWWLLVLPLAVVVVWVGVRQGLAPLAAATRELQARRPQELAPLDGNAPVEIRPLIDAINGLLGRQRRLIEQERRFSAEAAHELRTPLTTVRLRAERALTRRRGAAAPDADADAALASIVEETERAERVLGQLLTLARLDAADAEGQALAPLALLPLLRGLLASQADEALARDIELVLDVPESELPRVLAEPVSLGLMLRNLVDNAIRYAPAGSTVRVSVAREGDVLRLAVVDAGPGISPAQRRRLCEPFQRGDRHDESGTGLGLAIARRAAEFHGTRLAMADGPGGRGLAVSVHLQVASGT